jgi:hypothetical protein
MAHGSIGPGAVRSLVSSAWSAGAAPADPDDPRVRGFAEFGLPPDSGLATEDGLRDLHAWRDHLQIPANSAFLDGTLLMTVDALLGRDGPDVLTPVTLWELTTLRRCTGLLRPAVLPGQPGRRRIPFQPAAGRHGADGHPGPGLRDAQQQPSSPLVLPFFTAAVLQQATTLEDIWAQLARVRDQSAAFRRVRADLDRMLERSEVSADALRFQSALRDEALKLADLAGAAQQSASVALGVVGQTGIVPLAQALKVGVDAAQGVGRGGSWTRIWRRLFHRHEYFLAQTNTQAAALTNALPQLQQLWHMPRIGGYLNQFAAATQQMGHVLRGPQHPT